MSNTMSGFVEYTQAQREIEGQWLSAIERVLRLYGYASLETRCVETLKTLRISAESEKEAYRITKNAVEEEFTLGLRYDLTAGLARYVKENIQTLQFPFARYQAGTVWRGERPQLGRFREFKQVDLDIIGRDKLPEYAELQLLLAYSDVFDALGELGLPRVSITLNSRKLVQGYFESMDMTQEQILLSMRAIDKLAKTNEYEVFADLTSDVIGLSVGQAQRCLWLSRIRVTTSQELRKAVESLLVEKESTLMLTGLEEVCEVLDGLQMMNRTATADLSVMRGLDYYSGLIFECFMKGYENVGSICSGGRYDQLVESRSGSFPGVGISLGLTRILSLLFADGLGADEITPTASVLVSRFSDDDWFTCEQVARDLRARGISAQVVPSNWKVGKQLAYAQKRGMPYVLFIRDGKYEMKDIAKRTQEEVNITTWAPSVESDMI